MLSSTEAEQAPRAAGTGSAKEEPPAMPMMPGRPGAGRGHGGPGQAAKPKNMKATLRKMWTFVGRERRKLAGVFLLIACSAALSLAGPYLIGRAVDSMAAANGEHGGSVNMSLLKAALIGLTAAYAGDAVLTLFQGRLMAGISGRIIASLREDMFAKLQRLPLRFFDARQQGELMSRLSNDIDNVNSTLSQTVTQFMSGAIAIAGSFVMMLVLSPALTLASMITVPLVFLLARTVTRRTSVLFKAQQEHLGRLNGQVEESISGMEAVRAYNRQERMLASFREVNGKLYETGLRAQLWSGFLMPLMSVINNIGFTAVAFAGGILAVKGHLTVGVIASFLSYSRQFVRPLNDLANLYNVLLSGVAGAERAFELLEAEEERQDQPRAKKLHYAEGWIQFENVSFGYRPEEPILKQISFTAAPGSSTALIGRTGAGKTTLVNLLTRFYDPTEGRVLLEGKDLREYTRQSLREAFGIVLQDTYLFSGTIKENIKYGRPSASDTEVADAARLAHADGFIRRLPQGYDTVLTENGGNLSQGERQLLAIARVFLADPSILILDEATSSIDTRTELHIQKALAKVMKGRTSFIIAHRLNTIRHADTIIVMEQGTIAERGTHDELMELKGLYYEMNQTGQVSFPQ
ncbi:ABC transporter ATP-binding protein [Paenibacillus gansuensis]|uniref:ABC transporter ATP-binding protein n=1 Tax=Paenibacillus gansuensis TaxID=306542 RepID=A0ABW5PED4_9BACL